MPGQIRSDDASRDALRAAFEEMGNALTAARSTMREARSRLHGDYTGQSAKVFDNGMDRIEAAVGQLEIKRAAIQEAMTSFGRVTSQTEDANISLAGTVGISGGASWT